MQLLQSSQQLQSQKFRTPYLCEVVGVCVPLVVAVVGVCALLVVAVAAVYVPLVVAVAAVCVLSAVVLVCRLHVAEVRHVLLVLLLAY